MCDKELFHIQKEKQIAALVRIHAEANTIWLEPLCW
jgi:hypothetical protein